MGIKTLSAIPGHASGAATLNADFRATGEMRRRAAVKAGRASLRRR